MFADAEETLWHQALYFHTHSMVIVAYYSVYWETIRAGEEQWHRCINEVERSRVVLSDGWSGNTLHYIARDQALSLSQTCVMTRSFAFLCTACLKKTSASGPSALFSPTETCGVWYQPQIMAQYLKWSIKALVGAELESSASSSLQIVFPRYHCLLLSTAPTCLVLALRMCVRRYRLCCWVIMH